MRYATLVAAPAHAAARLLGDLSSWPLLFQRVERIELLVGREPEVLARIWVRERGGLADFTCRCRPAENAAGLVLEFVVTRPPLTELTVRWTVTPQGAWQSVVEVAYEFRVIGDAPEAIGRLQPEFARISDWDLRSIKEMVELNGFAGT
ncbi:MAG TPA: SRPBCC family protein [Actinospica sp.]|nr:SRPBCC family protein [Actinospica sp.]